jgi:hypothetical protein
LLCVALSTQIMISDCKQENLEIGERKKIKS